LNHAVYKYFTYESGSTENSTPIEVVWKQRRGVCQDFAHVMLSILRTAGIPARYVCGYIETDPPTPRPGEPRRRLIGAVATHAWVEVLLPGLAWVGLDPTNDKYCDDRHVAMSYGRDYSDATPIRGTFKGTGRQKLKVRIVMRRRNRPAPPLAMTAPANT
jgi:transglutaminase-like putative cysteine protease